MLTPVADVRIRGRYATLEQHGVAAERFSDFVSPTLDLHGLDVVLLTFVLRGTGRHVLDGAEHAITGPSFAVTRTGERHGLLTDGDPLEVVNVYLDVDAHPVPPLSPPLDRALAALLPLGDAPRLRLPQVAIDDVGATGALLELLERETRAPGPGTGDVVTALRRALLVECARAIAAHGFLPARTARTRTDIAVEDARAHLDRTFTERQSLAELAARVHLERTYLSRAFAAATGETVSEYLARLRVGYAAALLRTTDRSVAEVATTAGFRDLSHFGRTFKRLLGVSPRAYRRSA
jgi:AraC-like DNA-binding protein